MIFRKAAEEIARSHRNEIDRIQQTNQRGGGMRSVIAVVTLKDGRAVRISSEIRGSDILAFKILHSP